MIRRTVIFTVETVVDIDDKWNSHEDVYNALYKQCADTASKLETLAEDQLDHMVIDGDATVDRSVCMFEIKGAQQ